MGKVKFFGLGNGKPYTTAEQIEDFASLLGAKLCVDSNLCRHPGTVCTAAIKAILKDPALRNMYSLAPYDVIEIDVSQSPRNIAFVNEMIHRKVLSRGSVKNQRVTMYSKTAANAIVQYLVKDDEVGISNDVCQVFTEEFSRLLIFTPKFVEDPDEGLFKKTKIVGKVIDEFTPEEQAIIRRYVQRCRETRSKRVLRKGKQ
jgi:hypothetical protein